MVGCEVLTSGPPGPLPMPSDDALIVTKSQHRNGDAQRYLGWLCCPDIMTAVPLNWP